MDDLIAFLRARLDEDESLAQECELNRVSQPGTELHDWIEDPRWSNGLVPARELADRFSVARVLAEVDAKRRIIDDHTSPHTVVNGFCVEEGGPCTHADESLCHWHGVGGCSTVRLLALPYAGHPDYRQKWRPS